ncbi:hypothetical protein JZU71_00480, partial [bacterium]|nr:hypothetical protein [bacterium]
ARVTLTAWWLMARAYGNLVSSGRYRLKREYVITWRGTFVKRGRGRDTCCFYSPKMDWGLQLLAESCARANRSCFDPRASGIVFRY